MSRFVAVVCAILLIGPGLAAADAEDPPETCDPQNICPGPLYFVITKSDEVDLCGGGCADPNVPLYANLSCYGDGNLVHCQAWPRTGEAGYTIQYAWSASGGVHGSTDWGEFADMSFACSPGPHGQVTVSVASPYGFISTISVEAGCTHSGPIE